MAYPYPELVPLLEFHVTPFEYLHSTLLWKPDEKRVAGIGPGYEGYWAILPTYLFARCPLCGHEYREPLDTYSLDHWTSLNGLIEHVFLANLQKTPAPCSHFVGIHRFISLHGQSPDETSYFSNSTGDVPYLTPWLFAEDFKCYAVLHGLPICRIQGDQFLASYTLFILTYFSADRTELLRRHAVGEAEIRKDDPEYYPVSVMPAGAYDYLYHLRAWVNLRKLGWLDFRRPKLPLQFGIETDFPKIYHSIEGARYAYNQIEGKTRRTY